MHATHVQLCFHANRASVVESQALIHNDIIHYVIVIFTEQYIMQIRKKCIPVLQMT